MATEWLAEDGVVAILLVDLSALRELEEPYASCARSDWSEVIDETLGFAVKRSYQRFDDASSIGILLYPNSGELGEQLLPNDLRQMADRLEVLLQNRRHRVRFARDVLTEITVGYALALPNALFDERSALELAIREARDIAQHRMAQIRFETKHLLQSIILRGDVGIQFQPIFDIATGERHGFEALSRGPKGSYVERPEALFDAARKSALSIEIDHCCRRNAIRRAGTLPPQSKVFVNTLPVSPQDPRFRGLQLIELMEEANLRPEQVVFEVTERFAIRNYASFVEEMSYYTDLGCSTAVDDIGAGQSEIERIVHIQPQYLKLDKTLVRDVDQSFVKRRSIDLLTELARDIQAKVIAVGVQTERELETLRDLGVDYVQGFLLGRPSSHWDWSASAHSNEVAPP